ncbi:MAG: hypothetical protein IPP40_18155 [bacterium]|nr:hypothetical protein [bacterium]
MPRWRPGKSVSQIHRGDLREVVRAGFGEGPGLLPEGGTRTLDTSMKCVAQRTCAKHETDVEVSVGQEGLFELGLTISVGQDDTRCRMI